MNTRSFAYFLLGLAFLAASNPTYAQHSVNAIHSEYIISDPNRPLAAFEYEQILLVPDAANVLVNAISALGINYTADDLRTSLSKLKAKNVQASRPFFDNLILGDALLNEMRRGKLPAANVVRPNPPTQLAITSPQPGAPPASSQFATATSNPTPVASTAAVGPFNLGSIEGTYRFEPYSNAWQEGTLEAIGDFRLKWTNRAGVSWGLTANLQTGVLTKDNGSPYQEQPNGREFIVTRDPMGNVTGFQFQGAFYKKM